MEAISVLRLARNLNWFEKILNFWSFWKFDDGLPEFLFLHLTGNFTQIVWKATKEVGFGKAVKQGKCVIVAHYRPAGNVDGKFVRNVAPAKAGAKMPLPPKNTASKSVKGMIFVLFNHGKIVKNVFSNFNCFNRSNSNFKLCLQVACCFNFKFESWLLKAKYIFQLKDKFLASSWEGTIFHFDPCKRLTNFISMKKNVELESGICFEVKCRSQVEDWIFLIYAYDCSRSHFWNSLRFFRKIVERNKESVT